MIGDYEHDAVVALGGGLTEKGELSQASRLRIDTAVALYKCGVAPNLIATGFHPLRASEPERSEAEQMAEVAISEGVPEQAIATESESLETVGNAYFTKTIITEPKDLRDLLLITNGGHLKRSRYIFEQVMGPEYKISTFNADPAQKIKNRMIYEITGGLLAKLVLGRVEPGDDVAVMKRLVALVPGYGEQSKLEMLKNYLDRLRSAQA